MNIEEMHVWFRQYAQQMGMQNVRAILPEQIDLLINTSISDIVNQLIKTNIGISSDRIITDNSKIGQINAFRTLYKVKELPLLGSNAVLSFYQKDRITGRMSNRDISSDSRKADKPEDKNWDSEQDAGDGIDKNDNLTLSTKFPDTLFIVDFAIKYVVGSKGYNGDGTGSATAKSDGIETNFYPVRIIDDSYLADVLNDFILKPRVRTPIIVTYNNGIYDLYIDRFIKEADNTYYLKNKLIPKTLRMSYISKPAKVRYEYDLGGKNVDCDLPAYLHVDILKHAVELYNQSIAGNIQSAQSREQAQRREMVRNQAQPTPYGQNENAQ